MCGVVGCQEKVGMPSSYLSMLVSLVTAVGFMKY
jgi:hypothetical protein